MKWFEFEFKEVDRNKLKDFVHNAVNVNGFRLVSVVPFKTTEMVRSGDPVVPFCTGEVEKYFVTLQREVV